MPCHAAIAEKALSLKADTTVEKAIKAMKKAKVEHAAVTDADGITVGLLSFQILMKNLLPVSVAMSDGIQLDIKIQAAPGIAKRLKNVLILSIDALMERKDFPVVYPQTPTWEGVNQMVKTGLPIVVIEPETKKYIGLITQSSLLEELQRLQESEM